MFYLCFGFLLCFSINYIHSLYFIQSLLMWVLLVFVLKLCLTAPVDDPSQWPGHLKFFGQNQNTINVDHVYKWPSPSDFFRNYVDKGQPVLLKNVYKTSNAVKNWHIDDYLVGGNNSSLEEIYVEPHLKENRTLYGEKMTFEKFVNIYHNEPKVMFSTVPKHLMKDAYLPPPLTCNETSEYLINANLHMSRGRSKSVVCNEDAETIFCSVQGHYTFYLIEYTQNKNYVIDRPQGGYSTLDVERVDYTKYPNLRKVDQYVKGEVSEGDCLYIPYKWYKQMNGYENEYQRNIGLNFWFNHLHDHKPTTCDWTEHEATLDKFQFSDVIRLKEKEESIQLSVNITDPKFELEEIELDDEFKQYGPELERGDKYLSHFYDYLTYTKHGRVSFKSFYYIVRKDEGLSHVSHSDLTFPRSFEILVHELFRELDSNHDKRITEEDFREVFKDQKRVNRLSLYLDYQVARIEDYVDDLVEANHHDEPMHLFEERILEKFRNWRKFEL